MNLYRIYYRLQESPDDAWYPVCRDQAGTTVLEWAAEAEAREAYARAVADERAARKAQDARGSDPDGVWVSVAGPKRVFRLVAVPVTVVAEGP